MRHFNKLIALIGVMAMLAGCRSSRIQNIKNIESLWGEQNWIIEVKVKDIEIVNGLVRFSGIANGKKVYIRPLENYMYNPDSANDIRIEKGKTYLMVVEPYRNQTIFNGYWGPWRLKMEFPGPALKALNIRGLYINPITQNSFKYRGPVWIPWPPKSE